MPILYALVARGRNVLAEHTNSSGNFTTVTRVLLSKIGTNNQKRMSYVYDNHIFHYTLDGGIVFLCMCEDEKTTKKRIAFGFLENIQELWRNSISENIEMTAAAFAMQESFQPVLAREMEKFNNSPDSFDNIAKVKLQIESVKEVMSENIDNLLERGEKIELLVDRTDRLNEQSFKFERSTRTLKRHMLYKKLKMYALIFFLLGLFALFLSMVICGPDFKECPN